VLEKAGIARADMVVAVTGDDEDNIIIAQIAKLKYAVPKVVARVNNPFNQPTFDLLGVDATVCAATNLISLIMHELPAHKFVHLLSLKHENVELVELEVGDTSPFANTFIQDIDLPEGVLLAAILRAGQALLARGSTEILPGDYVLCLIQPGTATELIKVFLPEEEPTKVQQEAELDVSEG
jgi:trk system potassium uptake protein TrkA